MHGTISLFQTMSGNVPQLPGKRPELRIDVCATHTESRNSQGPDKSQRKRPLESPLSPQSTIDAVFNRVSETCTSFVPVEFTAAWDLSRTLPTGNIEKLLVGSFQRPDRGVLDLSWCDPEGYMHDPLSGGLVSVGDLKDLSTECTCVDLSVTNLVLERVKRECRDPDKVLVGLGLSTALNKLLSTYDSRDKGQGSAFNRDQESAFNRDQASATNELRTILEGLSNQSELIFFWLMGGDGGHIVLVRVNFKAGECSIFDDREYPSQMVYEKYDAMRASAMLTLSTFMKNNYMASAFFPEKVSVVTGKKQFCNACCIHAIFNFVNLLADEETRTLLCDCHPSKCRSSLTVGILAFLEPGFSLPVPNPSERK